MRCFVYMEKGAGKIVKQSFFQWKFHLSKHTYTLLYFISLTLNDMAQNGISQFPTTSPTQFHDSGNKSTLVMSLQNPVFSLSKHIKPCERIISF